MSSSSARRLSRPRALVVAGAALAIAVGAVAPLPGDRAAAEYQMLPSSSPKTWTYGATLKTLQQRSTTASQATAKAAATSVSADNASTAAKTAVSDAQAAEKAAAVKQADAKAALDKAMTRDEKAKAQADYNRAVGAHHAAIDAVKQKADTERQKAVAAKTAKTLATRAEATASLARTRVSRYQDMYGSSPSTAFTKLKATYTFPGDRRRPDSRYWTLYDTTKTAQPHARDPRYVGMYKNNLEVTSWGTIGSGACLCRGTSLPTTPYGRWEVRAKVNRNADHGVAILLWPNDRQGPQSGEIDLAEFNQPRTQANFALHYDAKNLQVQSHILGDFTQWHTYRVDWNSRGIAWYIDNNLFATVVDKATIPTKPFHLVVQAAPGSSKSSKTSTTVTVSSVKVYAP